MKCLLQSLLIALPLAAWQLTPLAAQDRRPAAHPQNHLAGETSPYLLMHVRNPVDWHPWGNEALEKARKERKPIFLSIGYSSCYWCHVMERESFRDADVAAYLNKHFVCIKVDREERPEIDHLYLAALQVYYQLIAANQRGGWPLSMFLTPEAEPFFGGTYFPPRGKLGPQGFLDVLQHVNRAWTGDPGKVRRDARTLVEAVQRATQGFPAQNQLELSSHVVDVTYAALAADFDGEWGGFGGSADSSNHAKFPEPSSLEFMLELVRTDKVRSADARRMLTTTLEKMARGGIWDHLGGGFHRYSTDRQWFVPHFEKMLYDNAQLASIYAQAYALTGRSDFAEVTRDILSFVEREMTSNEGAFFSAIDAETDAEEGKYYVWTATQLDAALEATERAVIDEVYGTGAETVFEAGHVLLLREPLSVIATRRGTSTAELTAMLAPIRAKLLTRRNERTRPLRDEKVITAWNGLMIRGFADGGRYLQDPHYTAVATTAAEFILSQMRTEDGSLWRTHTQGVSKLTACLDDYAMLADGLLALWKATGERKWLSLAEELTAREVELFWDGGQNGFYFTANNHEHLFSRTKQLADEALPAGNSVSADNLLMLAAALERPEYREQARQTISATVPLMGIAPAAAPRMAAVLQRYLESE